MFKCIYHLQLHATSGTDFIRQHGGDFAPGRLSIAHLQSMDPREYGAWCVAKKIDVSNNGSTAKMPEAVPFADMAGLRDACSNVGRLAADLGSPVLCAFAARLASFMRELPDSGVYGKAQVTVFSTWIDDACRQLHDELRAQMCGAQRAINVISVTHTPLLRFNQQLSERVMESRILQTTNKRQESDATGTQAKKAKAGATAKVKRPWFEHVPTHDRKKIFLKNLTKRGCVSNAAGECFNPSNVHHVPAIKLHPHVLQHIERMGGLNELHNALKKADPLGKAAASSPSAGRSRAVTTASGNQNQDHKWTVSQGVVERAAEEDNATTGSLIGTLLHYGIDLHNLRKAGQDTEGYGIDMALVEALTSLMRRSRLSIADMARIVRGESLRDPRPNKAVDLATIRNLFGGFEHHALLQDMWTRGFNPAFDQHEPSEPVAPRRRYGDRPERREANHKSVTDNPEARLQQACNTVNKGTSRLNCDGMRADAEFFAVLLGRGRLTGIPTTMFANVHPPDLHLYMDASDYGLAALASRRSTSTSATVAEAAFSINDWADPDRATHVRVWLDNTAAVAWTNSLNSPNVLEQPPCRALGLALAETGIHISAKHLPGAENTMADAGSREWQSESHAATWSPFADSWTRTRVPTHLRHPTTRAKYAVIWKHYNEWCTTNGRPVCLPTDRLVQSRQLFPFARHLHEARKNREATIRSKIGVVSWYHRCVTGYGVGLDAGHATALAGLERLEPTHPGREPVTAGFLQAQRANINLYNAKDRSIWGATVMGFFYFMRCSEYAATAAGTHLRLRDVSFAANTGAVPHSYADAVSVTIFFRSSKTDQAGAGTARTLYKSGNPELCPVGAAWFLTQNCKRIGAGPDDPLCCFADTNDRRHHVSGEMVSKALKSTARSLGLDPERYSSHSLRSGGATALFLGGATDLTVQQFGCWKSDAYKVCTRIDVKQQSTFAAIMISSLAPSATQTGTGTGGGTIHYHYLYHPRGTTTSPRERRNTL
ncbi:hypothetical protein SPRG_17466 [Saprolegnia parasitica CBS 223.65]|uniref:Tyr recombinase domain-containing protein n=1 Tax=Saprolegnia parasitica (strain CBS 223.65) TaxID=695850 RepID=A0A067BG43_SAPPC|nr:hypothetical protein SPRG_17466 [Saprolegnia parasitica CBS 223.65]KDO17123.1 hypothetical protein SPRG_17466 [Saprolegnia parasitica CBS 223.65]|eukprot:XP_012212169.1 hypothetical protein SPRG_17466 [Saprolegnia parasitica CBS 223.65]